MSGGGHKSENIFEKIISLENLFLAWNEFKKGKENKKDVQRFTLNLEDNIFSLYYKLENDSYRHSHYTSFYISDPKLRHIHKAKVRDRLLHHAIIRIINPIFEKSFIFDSYSSRKNKGTHRAIKRLWSFAWRLSRNNTKTVWVLKCDIKKFFESVDHNILLNLLKKKISDEKTSSLLKEIIRSFNGLSSKGIPLGNLTSQLFSNIYLNEMDQFIKRKLRIKYYIRYADDFVVLSSNELFLKNIIHTLGAFLKEKLDLRLHSRKVIIEKWNRGIDFLGYVSFPYYFALRTKTKKRMLKRTKIKTLAWKSKTLNEKSFNQTLQSYLGILRHCRRYGLLEDIKSVIFYS